MTIKERFWREIKEKERRERMNWYKPWTWWKGTSATTEVPTPSPIPARLVLEIDIGEVRRRVARDPAASQSWKSRMAEGAVDIEPVLTIIRADLESLQREKSSLEERHGQIPEKISIAEEAILKAFEGVEPMDLEEVRDLQEGIEELQQDLVNAKSRLNNIDTSIQNIQDFLQ